MQTRSLRAHLADEGSSASISVSDIAPDAETYIVCQGGESGLNEDLNRQEIDLCPGDSDGVRRLSGDDELLFEQDGDTWVLQN